MVLETGMSRWKITSRAEQKTEGSRDKLSLSVKQTKAQITHPFCLLPRSHCYFRFSSFFGVVLVPRCNRSPSVLNSARPRPQCKTASSRRYAVTNCAVRVGIVGPGGKTFIHIIHVPTGFPSSTISSTKLCIDPASPESILASSVFPRFVPRWRLFFLFLSSDDRFEGKMLRRSLRHTQLISRNYKTTTQQFHLPQQSDFRGPGGAG